MVLQVRAQDPPPPQRLIPFVFTKLGPVPQLTFQRGRA
jgi:hypothetical protein